MFVSLVGQVWYQLVTTAGLFGIGTVAAVEPPGRGTRKGHRGCGSVRAPSVVDARLVLLVVGALAALSVVFMTDRWRPDQVVYGRYNDAVVGPVLIIALGWLVTPRRLATTVATYGGVVLAMVGSGILLDHLRADELGKGVGVRVMILGLQAFIGTATAIHVMPITLAGVIVTITVGLVVVLGQRTGWRGALLVVLALLMVFSFGRTRATRRRRPQRLGDGHRDGAGP